MAARFLSRSISFFGKRRVYWLSTVLSCQLWQCDVMSDNALTAHNVDNKLNAGLLSYKMKARILMTSCHFMSMNAPDFFSVRIRKP